jgi:hypothetical protein
MLDASLALLQNVEQVAWDIPAQDAMRDTLHHDRLPHSRQQERSTERNVPRFCLPRPRALRNQNSKTTP